MNPDRPEFGPALCFAAAGPDHVGKMLSFGLLWAGDVPTTRAPGSTALASLVLRGAARCELRDGRIVHLEAKDALLLAWLALEGPTPRARLVALLWPDADSDRAHAARRQRLARLKRKLGFDPIGSGDVACLQGLVLAERGVATTACSPPSRPIPIPTSASGSRRGATPAAAPASRLSPRRPRRPRRRKRRANSRRRCATRRPWSPSIRRWIDRVAASLPDAYRDSFLDRNPINRELRGLASRELAATR